MNLDTPATQPETQGQPTANSSGASTTDSSASLADAVPSNNRFVDQLNENDDERQNLRLMKFNPITLTFGKVSLEQRFLKFFAGDYTRWQGLALLSITYLVTYFFIADYVADRYVIPMSIRGGAILITAICILVLMLKFKFVNANVKEILAAVVFLVLGVCIGVLECFFVDSKYELYDPRELLIFTAVFPISLRIRFFLTVPILLVSTVGSFVASYFIFRPHWTLYRFFAFLFIILIVDLFSLIAVYSLERKLRQLFVKSELMKLQQQHLEVAKQRTEELLQNILPASIVDGMKKNYVEELVNKVGTASVLFSDVVGFTSWSAKTEPQLVVKTLNRMFSEFDLIADKLMVEKIKTIGDAYFASCGVPVAAEDHCVRLAAMSLRMLESLKRVNVLMQSNLNLRIGLATGPVLGTILGTKKISFEVLGETVSIAHYMEATSISGGIQITSEYHHEIRKFFKCKKRSPPIKDYKDNDLQTYFIIKEKINVMEMLKVKAEEQEHKLERTYELQDQDNALFGTEATTDSESSHSLTDLSSRGTLRRNSSAMKIPTLFVEDEQDEEEDVANETAVHPVAINESRVTVNTKEVSFEEEEVIMKFKPKKVERRFMQELHNNSKMLVRFFLFLSFIYNTLFVVVEILLMVSAQDYTVLYHWTAICQYAAVVLNLVVAVVTLFLLQHRIAGAVGCCIFSLVGDFHLFSYTSFPDFNMKCAVFYVKLLTVTLFLQLPLFTKFMLMLISTLVFLMSYLFNTRLVFYPVTIVEAAVAVFLIVLAAHLLEATFRKSFQLDNKITKKIESCKKQREKAEDLLTNVIPKPVIARLKKDPNSIFDYVTQATVMFVDVVDFENKMTKEPDVKVLLGKLNSLFRLFDDLVSSFDDTEKIKTVGSLYMVTSGNFNSGRNHAANCAMLALAMLRAVKERYKGELEVKIGLHSGPLVAAVLGTRKFAYDLWGDTVNTSSRLESSAAPNTIQVSEDTYQMLKDDFDLQYRGTIPLKGKGDYKIYILLGKLD